MENRPVPVLVNEAELSTPNRGETVRGKERDTRSGEAKREQEIVSDGIGGGGDMERVGG